ncbi:hypothetical protein L6164_033241 [Bauhinia variegata]|uniref:Uncharacterized protein n=1 Tax=Bauhinia variegata TaxID=167791 RepID=A0ACB9KR81_BAUVA|nr:hypothetical protein L6164_033241 [Bauhinia variegata]
MKIALLALFFLLFTFTKAEYIYDTDGERLSEAHSNYIFVGAEPIGASEFTLPDTGNENCPLPLMASPPLPSIPPAIPVKFSNHLLYPFATTETPLNLTFVNVPRCSKTSQWFVAVHIPDILNLLFGDAYVRGYFCIKKHGDKTYKIIYCSRDVAQSHCGHVAYADNDLNLVVKFGSDDALVVTFHKVKSGISMVV